MKIYYVMSDWVIDCDSSGSPRVALFKNFEEAKERFLAEKKDIITDSDNWSETNSYGEEMNKGIDSSEEDLENGTASFCVYENRRYSENHINVEMGYQEI